MLAPRRAREHAKSSSSAAIAAVVKRASVTFAWLLASCAADPVAITDRCEPLGEAAFLHPNEFDGWWSIGLVDGQVIFSFAGRTTSEERPYTARARWFDESLAPTTEVFWLGDGTYLPGWRWIAVEHRAWAQIWAVPAGPRGRFPALRQQIGVYAIAPASADFERISIELPIIANYDGTDITPLNLRSSSGTALRELRAPAAIAHGRPVFVLSAIPSAPVSCADYPYANAARLMAFDLDAVTVHQYGDDPCSAVEGGGDHEAHDPTLVALRDGGLGVFYRTGNSSLTPLFYSRIGPDLRVLDQPPFHVGANDFGHAISGGYQARATQLDSGAILFTERSSATHGIGGDFTCSDLRLVDPDGRNARAAPWQLPCRPLPDTRREPRLPPTVTQWIAVEPLANGHAALAYAERTSFERPYTFARTITEGMEWEEGVYLTTIDGEGRRASQRVTVTPPQATATWPPGTPRTPTSGPGAGDFEIEAATEGDLVVVAWRDNRGDLPGYYARRFRCAGLAD